MRREGLFWAVLLAVLAGAVHPLRREVERRRQDVLGYRESPARRLALGSQFGFLTAAGASYRMVPGGPVFTIEDVPTQAVLTVLGGFRGPYAVYLWIQVEEEKHRRQHFSLVDRYFKIASLQPDYDAVWVFHIWNLAYNISAQWHSMEHKYQWIRRAVEFGEEGHRRNPRSAEVMASLGNVYMDKLGLSQEAPHYRRRVREDEGRSTFLAAHDWFDRARKANDLYGTLGHGLSKTVVYSQACHAATYYATEETLAAYGDLESGAEARRAGSASAAAGALHAGLARLDEAVAAWDWARREWQDHAARWDREDVSTMLRDVYIRFYSQALQNARALREFRAGLSYDSLPRYRAAALTEDAALGMERCLERRASDREASARAAFEEGMAGLAEALEVWPWAIRETRAAASRLTAASAPADQVRRFQDAADQDAAFLADLERFRAAVTYDNLPHYRAATLTQRARTAFEESLSARQSANEEAAREAFGRGMRALADALEAWREARQFAAACVARLAKEGAPAADVGAAKAREAEAVQQVQALAALGPVLTDANLAEHLGGIHPPPDQWPRPPVVWPARGLKF